MKAANQNRNQTVPRLLLHKYRKRNRGENEIVKEQ
jgi:hypothetical protein